jgi:HAD superfamily hydrolase (TIGR01490 family)
MAHDVLALLDSTTRCCPTTPTSRSSSAFARQLDRATFEAANLELGQRYRRGEVNDVEFYLSTLKPFTSAELEELHRTFMRERIKPSIPPPAIVAKHRKLGHFIVLTTATSRFLTGPIALELGFENHIATEPEIREGRYTGRILGTPNMREGKVERLLVWLAERDLRLSDFRESWFYSDSQNDLPLLSHVTHPVAVNADPVLAAHARQGTTRSETRTRTAPRGALRNRAGCAQSARPIPSRIDR